MKSFNNKKAFTLIEMSIVLTIMALIIGAALSMSKMYDKKNRLFETKQDLNKIKHSILGYSGVNHKLPSADYNNDGKGDGNYSTNSSQLGFIPFADLQLNENDEFGMTYYYDVNDSILTSETNFDFCQALSNINITTSFPRVQDHLTPTATSYGVAAIIVSSGEDKILTGVLHENNDRIFEMKKNTYNNITNNDLVIEITKNELFNRICKAKNTYSSCNELLNNIPTTISGVYTINPSGIENINVYCDMDNDEGGWTLVAAQYEADPETSWDKGIQADYDPSLVTNKSFALNSLQIPYHTQTSFGKDLNATYLDYFNFIYTTKDIQTPISLTSMKNSSNSYFIYRDINHYYQSHNPKNIFVPWTNTDVQRDTLSVELDDLIDQNDYIWAFSSKQSVQASRGYSFNGDLSSSTQTYAWTVWVR